jgi:hypothetical protein
MRHLGKAFSIAIAMTLAAGSAPLRAQTSPKIVAMIAHNDGVITAFTDGRIYWNEYGHDHLGGGGATKLVYPGPQRVVAA